MKKSNLLNLFTKVVFACFVFILTAKTAFAQVTLDLDVLLDEIPAKKTLQEEKASLKKQEKTVKKAAPPQKPKKVTPAVKPVVKKTPVPAKPVVKKVVAKPTEKYRVKETEKKDAHDKLKPHAAPVPNVKVLASSNSLEASEDPKTENNVPTNQNVPKQTEPKISKHFLKQQLLNKKEETVSPAKQKIEQKPVASEVVKETVSLPEKPKNLQEKHPVVAETKSLKEPETLSASPALNFSVFPVSEKLTQTERSAELSKNIPAESATIKALSDKKKALHHIFVFEPRSIELTEEMENELNSIAGIMRTDKNKRLILYAYSSTDPAVPGKERQYALRRALMIRSYLTTKGIHSLRIGLRAQGLNAAGDKIPDRTDLVFHEK